MNTNDLVVMDAPGLLITARSTTGLRVVAYGDRVICDRVVPWETILQYAPFDAMKAKLRDNGRVS